MLLIAMKSALSEKIFVLAFFKRLRRQSLVLFWLFAICTAFQLFLTAAKLDITPFLLYGMYSENFKAAGNVTRDQILIDTVPLGRIKMSQRERYLLGGAMDHYIALKMNGNKDIVESRIERMKIVPADYPLLRQKVFNDSSDMKNFETWFKQKCSNLLNKQVDTVRVIRSNYLFNGDLTALNKISSEQVASF